MLEKYMRKINAEECIAWARKRGVVLFPYQEAILRAFCNGEEVRTARGIGRTYVAKLFGEYVAHVYDHNDMDAEPDLIIPWKQAIACGIVNEDVTETTEDGQEYN